MTFDGAPLPPREILEPAARDVSSIVTCHARQRSAIEQIPPETGELADVRKARTLVGLGM